MTGRPIPPRTEATAETNTLHDAGGKLITSGIHPGRTRTWTSSRNCAEHEQVAKLIATLEERGRDEKTCETLRAELTAHSKAEEQVFYRRRETEASVRDTVLEGCEEHKVVVKLLSDMAQTTADEEKFAAKVAVLKESVEHHVEEEEGGDALRGRAAAARRERTRVPVRGVRGGERQA